MEKSNFASTEHAPYCPQIGMAMKTCWNNSLSLTTPGTLAMSFMNPHYYYICFIFKLDVSTKGWDRKKAAGVLKPD